METKYIFIIALLITFPVLLYACSKMGILDMNKTKNISGFSKSIYDYSAVSIDGEELSMEKYKGKKILIVNVASRCGFTPQYSDLQKLQTKFSDDLVVLGFPSNDFMFQEPGDKQKIKEFCTVNYGITFQLFDKIVVKNKKQQHPIYTWLSNKDLNGSHDGPPSWNFCKYLIDEDGAFVKYFNSKVKPLDQEIISLIKNDES